MPDPTESLDEVVHQRSRLGILTILREARRVDFSFVRSSLGLTAGNLSRHLQVLEEAGLVAIEKGYQGRRAKTWIAITPEGIAALQDEIRALKEIVARVEKAARLEPRRARSTRAAWATS